jgi:hypothetical protein
MINKKLKWSLASLGFDDSQRAMFDATQYPSTVRQRYDQPHFRITQCRYDRNCGGIIVRARATVRSAVLDYDGYGLASADCVSVDDDLQSTLVELWFIRTDFRHRQLPVTAP